MPKTSAGWLLTLMACGGGGASTPSTTGGGTDGTGAGTSDDASEFGPQDGTGTTAQASDTGVPPSSSSGDDGSDGTGDPPQPTTTAACNGDGLCDRDLDETCAACPDECGSCDVADLPRQRAKYVDLACPNMGDGLVDTCADAPGAPGRFNALQPALDSLEAGDTLYLHPGDYWRDVEPSDSGAVHTIAEDRDGTAERPIVVTAADRDALPVLHSCDPDDPEQCPAPAIAAYGDHIVLDHLAIRGRAQLWGGSDSTLQYLDCTYGWGFCGDGNWSCLRIESSTRGHAHHNLVHDMGGAGAGEACSPPDDTVSQDRGCGLKEFSSDGNVWEFNTIDGAPRWGYDLHRNSQRTTVRFNAFQDIHQGVTIARTVNPRVYGNTFTAARGSEDCIDILMLDEHSPGATHLAEVHHNTCYGPQGGITVRLEMPSSVHDNVIAGLTASSESPRNVVLEVIEAADHNAYDANGNFRRETYEDSTYSATLEAWQAATGQDAASIVAPGGACTFVDPPLDMHLSAGACTSAGSDGGEVGPYAITSCVGHTCG